MSHHRSKSGRAFVECDEPLTVTLGNGDQILTRCMRVTRGRRDERMFVEPSTPLGLYDLPAGWSVAPYPDDYEHGATRTSLTDGREIPPFRHLRDIVGDLHTCPACRKRMQQAHEAGRLADARR